MGAIFGTLWGAVWGKDDPQMDALEIATDKGDTASVVELLKSADLNCKEIRAKAVSVAAVHGNEECLDLLIQAGADVNWSSCRSTVAIVSAAWHGHSKCLDLLLAAGAEVNTQDEYGNTPLVLAAWNGHTVCLESLLQAGADVNTHNIEGSTAVYFAASEGHENCLRELIKVGANVNNLDLNENSALHKATVNNKAVCVELLIQAGADVNIRYEHGDTALIRAAEMGYDKCVDLLIHGGADVNIAGHNIYATALIQAARYDWHRCVDLLIQAGADVNAADFVNNTVLMSAVGDSEDLFAPTFNERDPFSLGTSRIKSVQLLLAAGADVNRTNVHGQTALYFHRHRGVFQDKDIPMLLIAAGEKLDETNVTIEDVLDALYETGQELYLKHMCRETIREHLIQCNPHLNLFLRIPKLGLPSLLTRYLLYDMALDTEYADDDNNDDVYADRDDDVSNDDDVAHNNL